MVAKRNSKKQDSKKNSVGAELVFVTIPVALVMRILLELNATERAILSFIQALDPYGDRFVKIGQIARGEPVKGKKVDPVFVPIVDIPCLQMTAKTFRKALATLERLGYVARDLERSPGVWLKNLHGSRCKSVPIPPRERKTVSDTEEKLDSSGKNLDSLSREPDSSSGKMISATKPETLAEQGQNFSSRSSQEVLKKPSKASWNLEDLAAATQPTFGGSAAAAAGRENKEEAAQDNRVCPTDKNEFLGEKENGLGGDSFSAAAADRPEEVSGCCDTSKRQEEVLQPSEDISGNDVYSAAGNRQNEVMEKAIALGYYPIPEQQVVLATMSDRQLEVVISEFVAAIRRGSRLTKRQLFDHAIRRGRAFQRGE